MDAIMITGFTSSGSICIDTSNCSDEREALLRIAIDAINDANEQHCKECVGMIVQIVFDNGVKLAL